MKRETLQMFRSPMFLIVGVVLTWFIITFLLWPNTELLRTVFVSDPGEMAPWTKLSLSAPAQRSLMNSLFLAVVLSITVNIVGVFLVLVTKYFDIKGAKILWLGYATTLIYGGIVLVSGYKFLYGSNGMLTAALQTVLPGLDSNWFTGAIAVIFVMTFATTGNHLLFLSSAMSKVDYQTIEAAKQMGASTWTVLMKIVLPVLRPTLLAITILTFLGGLGALAAPQVLGGRDFQTISPMILTFANQPSSRDLAAVLALILAAVTFLLLIAMNHFEKGGTYFSVSKVPVALVKQKIDNPIANIAVHAAAYLLFLIYALPPVLIFLFSFTDAPTIASGRLDISAFTLENYARVFTDRAASWPFVVSIMYSGAAAAIVIVGVTFIARIISRYRNRITIAWEYLLHIPWVMPGVMLALGLILAFNRPNILVGGQVLQGTVMLLGIAYVIGKIPFTLRLMKAAFTGINANLEEAASMLGAGQFYTFRRVLLPLFLPSAAAITALNFTSMLDDYDTAVFLAHPFYQPLGIFIKNATEGETQGDTTALTFVYTVALMVISGLTMYLVYGRNSASGAPRGKRRARARSLFSTGGLQREAAATSLAASTSSTLAAAQVSSAASATGEAVATAGSPGTDPHDTAPDAGTSTAPRAERKDS